MKLIRRYICEPDEPGTLSVTEIVNLPTVPRSPQIESDIQAIKNHERSVFDEVITHDLKHVAHMAFEIAYLHGYKTYMSMNTNYEDNGIIYLIKEPD